MRAARVLAVTVWVVAIGAPTMAQPDGLGTPPPRTEYAERLVDSTVELEVTAPMDEAPVFQHAEPIPMQEVQPLRQIQVAETPRALATEPSIPIPRRKPYPPRLNLAGGWTLPGGGLVTFNDRRRGEQGDTYTVRTKINGEDVVLQGVFDGRTLTTQRVRSQRAQQVGMVGRLEGRRGEDGWEATVTEPAGTYTFTRGKSGLQLKAKTDVDPGGSTPSKRFRKRSNRDVVLVGMNATSKHEASGLRKSGSKVTHIGDASHEAKVRAGGKTYDLEDDHELEAFVRTFGLPEAQSRAIAEAIAMRGSILGSNARDEMARVAQVWAKAERGGVIPSRMVISGHHVGDGVYGDDNGQIGWEDWQALADAMPNAAAQVEHLHVAACYSGGEELEKTYRKIFPNLKTVWAYTGSAPGSYSGAVPHERAWERATRGFEADVADDAQTLADRKVRKAQNIYSSDLDSGTQVDRPTTESLTRAVEDGMETFDDYLYGTREVTNSQTGELREYYNRVQRALTDPNLDPGDREEIETIRDQGIRLLYYRSHIAPRFAREYAEQIRSGYEAVGLPVPNFGTLTRGQALAEITRFRGQVDAAPPRAAQELSDLLQGLRELDSTLIPENWI